MSTRTAERTEFLADILAGFAEDFGYNSWRRVDAYRVGEFATFFDVEGNEPNSYTFTPNGASQGIARILDGSVPIAARHLQTIRWADSMNDAGDLDAELCDCIAQACVFGAIVYG